MQHSHLLDAQAEIEDAVRGVAVASGAAGLADKARKGTAQLSGTQGEQVPLQPQRLCCKAGTDLS